MCRRVYVRCVACSGRRRERSPHRRGGNGDCSRGFAYPPDPRRYREAGSHSRSSGGGYHRATGRVLTIRGLTSGRSVAESRQVSSPHSNSAPAHQVGASCRARSVSGHIRGLGRARPPSRSRARGALRRRRHGARRRNRAGLGGNWKQPVEGRPCYALACGADIRRS